MTIFSLYGQEAKPMTEKEFKKISSKIYPVIKVIQAGTNSKEEVELKGENMLVFKKLVGDLACFYGIDRGSYFELLLQGKLPPNKSLEEIDLLSRENLLRSVQANLQIHSTSFGGYGFSCGGMLEAALITLPEVWNIITTKLGKNVIFAVPSKDLVVFVKADAPADIASLQDIVEEVHKDVEKPLSKNLFRYQDGEMSIYKN
jgi:uncharacterized protein YtpQ (UPF0354 family)